MTPATRKAATRALKTYCCLIRDARRYPALADVRLRAAYGQLLLRLELETTT